MPFILKLEAGSPQTVAISKKIIDRIGYDKRYIKLKKYAYIYATPIRECFFNFLIKIHVEFCGGPIKQTVGQTNVHSNVVL